MITWVIITVAVLLVIALLAATMTAPHIRLPDSDQSTAAADTTPPDVDDLARGIDLPHYKVGATISSGKSTGYGYPGDPTGGGTIGYKGHQLYNTQDFFAGRSTYVSVALNPDLMRTLWPRRDRQLKNAPMMFSPALDLRYASELARMGLKHLPLVAMDIGPGVARQQIDVYVASKAEAFALPGSPKVSADILVRRDSTS
jgi:hypothetical protein